MPLFLPRNARLQLQLYLRGSKSGLQFCGRRPVVEMPIGPAWDLNLKELKERALLHSYTSIGRQERDRSAVSSSLLPTTSGRSNPRSSSDMRHQSLHNSSQADRARVLCSIVRDSQKHYNAYRACRTMKLSQREWHSEAFRKFQEYPESFRPLLEKGVFGVSIQSIVLLCAGEVFIPNSHVRHRWALLLGPWASAGTWDWDVACSSCSAWSREPPQKLRQ